MTPPALRQSGLGLPWTRDHGDGLCALKFGEVDAGLDACLLPSPMLQLRVHDRSPLSSQGAIADHASGFEARLAEALPISPTRFQQRFEETVFAWPGPCDAAEGV